MVSNVSRDPWSQLTSQNVLRSSASPLCFWFCGHPVRYPLRYPGLSTECSQVWINNYSSYENSCLLFRSIFFGDWEPKSLRNICWWNSQVYPFTGVNFLWKTLITLKCSLHFILFRTLVKFIFCSTHVFGVPNYIVGMVVANPVTI